MAKQKKKARYVKVAGLRVPRTFMRAVGDFAQSRMGKIIIAEALVLAAGALVRKHPVETAAAAGGAVANMAGTAAEAAAGIMSSAADHLKAGIHAGEEGLKGERRTAGQSPGDGSKPGNGSRGIWGNLDPDTVRDAVVGEFSGKKRKKRKAKAQKL